MQTITTQEKYRIRAFQLTTQAKKDCENNDLTAQQIAQWLIDNQGRYSKSTWRQYRASLAYVFTQQAQIETSKVNDLIAAITMLQQTTPPSAHPERRQTSAQKQKKISDTDLIRLMDYFSAKPSRHSLATQAWLLAGLWVGLRPCEWESAQFNDLKELVVTNAKATQGRAHGVTRTIDMTHLNAKEEQIIRLQLEFVQQAKLSPGREEKSGFELHYNHCRACLYEATRTLWPKRKQYISLYSARHQFAANAKCNNLPLEQIAALMGHASIETAMAHYGRRTAGSGGMKVKAHGDDVARVTALNQKRMNNKQSDLRM